MLRPSKSEKFSHAFLVMISVPFLSPIHRTCLQFLKLKFAHMLPRPNCILTPLIYLQLSLSCINRTVTNYRIYLKSF